LVRSGCGNEPFWACARRAGLTYTTPDYPRGIRFPSSAPDKQGTTLRWVAITAPDAHTLEVTLEARPARHHGRQVMDAHRARGSTDGPRLW
jgi:uncharacterized membrane protein